MGKEHPDAGRGEGKKVEIITGIAAESEREHLRPEMWFLVGVFIVWPDKR